MITECQKAPFERIIIDILEIPIKQYVLTILSNRHTKFKQACSIADKTVKTIVNVLIFYFHHFVTTLTTHCDSDKEFDNNLMNDLGRFFEIKLTNS